jgi:putative copper export protein
MLAVKRPHGDPVMKYVLIAVLAVIVLSLADAMFYLARDNGRKDRDRVVKALTVRIGLSLLLFIMVILSAVFGLIEPHGLAK